MKKFPVWFYIAVCVNIISWIISWLHIQPLHHFIFIFLIGSYIFILDGINYFLNSSSIFSSNKKEFIFIWLISSLFWWYFEFIVLITKNWYYFSSLYYGKFTSILSDSIYFTTVIIGVWEIYEILSSKVSFEKVKLLTLPKISPIVVFIIGWLSIGLTIIRPDIFFPMIWLSPFFILDPINYWLGYDSLSSDLLKGKYDKLFKLALSSLCFFVFWEMWNYKNDPKWVYEVPYVGIFKIFEMPALGYLGYLPFGWEIYAFYSFIKGTLQYPGYSVDQISVQAKPNWKQAYFIILILLAVNIGTIFALQTIANHNVVESPSLSQETTESDTILVFKGQVFYCNYSIYYSMCLETHDQRYWLIDTEGKRFKFEPGYYQITGTVIKKTVGMNEVVVKEIVKLD